MEQTFSTERLPLAVFLHAGRRLRFLQCERVGPGRVRFVFDDPLGQSRLVEQEFDRGALVPAIGFFNSLKFMRRQMDASLAAHDKEQEDGQTRQD